MHDLADEFLILERFPVDRRNLHEIGPCPSNKKDSHDFIPESCT